MSVLRKPAGTFPTCNIYARIIFISFFVQLGICFDALWELVPVPISSVNADFVGPNFWFMEDNARFLVAGEIFDYLNQVGIPVIQWAHESKLIHYSD